MGWTDDVLEFHRRFGVPVKDRPDWPIKGRVHLRMALIDEEHEELIEAVTDGNMAETADAIADLIYVLIGMAHEFGIPLDRVWDEVHRSNMAKVGGGERADGKIMKPEDWQPPDISGVLAAAKA